MNIDKHHFYIDPNRPVPLYYQIQENIAELIELKLFAPGDPLPSERELSKIYQVSRLTVRQAIDHLVKRGLIYKQHGVATFVAERSPLTAFEPAVSGFSQRMREAGQTPSSRVLEQQIITAPPLVYHTLEMRATDDVVRLKRMRLADDEPLMIETSYLPLARFPDLLTRDFESQSLYQILEDHYHVVIHSVDQTLEPTVLNDHEAALFGIEPGAPAMLVQIVAYAYDRTPVEFTKSVVRGDKCRFYFRVQTHRPIVS